MRKLWAELFEILKEDQRLRSLPITDKTSKDVKRQIKKKKQATCPNGDYIEHSCMNTGNTQLEKASKKRK
jgi:hypothetical protein